MKRIVVLFLVLAMVLSFAACGDVPEDPTVADTSEETADMSEDSGSDAKCQKN